MHRPPVPDELLRAAKDIAGWRLTEPAHVERAVVEAQNKYYQYTTRIRTNGFVGRPDRVPMLPATEPSLLFQWCLCEVLLFPRRWWGLPPPQIQREWVAEYLLVLLYHTMRKWVDPVALAVGCILLGMRPSEVTGITNTTTRREILGNQKAWLLRKLRGHFPQLKTREGRIQGTPANDQQQEIAHDFLELFASWREFLGVTPVHFGADEAFNLFNDNSAYENPPGSLNDDAVLAAAVYAALERNHTIACSFLYTIWCAPDRWIVPDFVSRAPSARGSLAATATSARPGGTISSGGNMNRHASELAALQKRRGQFRPPDDSIRIDLEGSALPFDPVERRSIELPNLSRADSIRVLGQDREGELLLAIVPFPDPAECSGAIERITLEGGQRIQAEFTRLDLPQEADAQTPEDDELRQQGLEAEDPEVLWMIELTYRETRPDRWLALALRRLQHGWQQPAFLVRRLGALTAALFVLVGAGYGISEYGRLLERYAGVIAQLGFADPFEVEFSAVDRNSLEVRVELDRNIVEEVWVDWGDPNVEGEEKLYPSPEASEDAERPSVWSVHDYGEVGRGGLRTLASVRIVPTEIPEPSPATLTADKLKPDRRLLVLPVGLILDPPAWHVEFVSPTEGEVGASVRDIELRVGGVTAPIHLLAREASATGSYLYLAMLEGPAFAEERTFKRRVDLSPLGPVGSVDILALSAEGLRVGTSGRVDPDALPRHAPAGRMHITLPAAVLEPTTGAVVGENETVHLKSNLDGFVAVAIRPVSGGTFWIQNSGLPTTGGVQRIAVVFGAVDDFELYAGITEDADLFVRGTVLGQLQDFDSAGKRVVWVGPVVVHRKE